MIGQLTVPTSESSIPQVAEGVFVARAEVADWMVEPVSHRCLTRLLDCDYPRWRDARSEDFRARFAATRHFAKSVVARVADLPVEDIELRRCTSAGPVSWSGVRVAAEWWMRISRTPAIRRSWR